MIQQFHSWAYIQTKLIQKGTYTPMLKALSTTAKTWKQPNCSLADEWINKKWYIYTMEYYSAIKKKTVK